MAALSPERWTVLRARWELGLESTRALAARFGVSERAVRKRATSPRDPWRRDGEAAERARGRAREATLRALAAARSAALPPRPGCTQSSKPPASA
jgi:hypothetical protein